MKCIMCRRELQRGLGGSGPPSRAMDVEGGGTVEVSFGYGSRLDCQMALGFICDECFDGNRHLFVNHYNGLAGLTKPPL